MGAWERLYGRTHVEPENQFLVSCRSSSFDHHKASIKKHGISRDKYLQPVSYSSTLMRTSPRLTRYLHLYPYLLLHHHYLHQDKKVYFQNKDSKGVCDIEDRIE